MNPPQWTEADLRSYQEYAEIFRDAQTEAVRMDAWRELEKIKNRHNGHSPPRKGDQ